MCFSIYTASGVQGRKTPRTTSAVACMQNSFSCEKWTVIPTFQQWSSRNFYKSILNGGKKKLDITTLNFYSWISRSQSGPAHGSKLMNKVCSTYGCVYDKGRKNSHVVCWPVRLWLFTWLFDFIAFTLIELYSFLVIYHFGCNLWLGIIIIIRSDAFMQPP